MNPDEPNGLEWDQFGAQDTLSSLIFKFNERVREVGEKFDSDHFHLYYCPHCGEGYSLRASQTKHNYGFELHINCSCLVTTNYISGLTTITASYLKSHEILHENIIILRKKHIQNVENYISSQQHSNL